MEMAGSKYILYADKKGVFFSIEDNGPGIAPDQVETVFQPFTQGDSARGSVGSGLGLGHH